MTISPFLYALIAEKQTSTNQAYYAIRAPQCFSCAKQPSWVDVYVDRVLPEQSSEGSGTVANNTSQSLANVASIPRSTVRAESELELDKLLKDHDSALKIFFLRQKTPISRLSISSQLFDTLCQRNDIFEKFRDYVMCFGLPNGEFGATPPVMHYHLSYGLNSNRPARLECAYILRFVLPNPRHHGDPWLIDQSGVYNTFDVQSSSMTWLFIALSPTAESQLDLWRAASGAKPPSNPFEVHYMLFDIAISSWRRYIIYLASEVQKQSDRAILADLEKDGHVVTRLEERQYLKQMEDNVTDLISCLSFMRENVDVVMNCYRDYQAKADLTGQPRQGQTAYTDAILKGFGDRKKDLVCFDLQAQALRRKVDSASTLVSNILDLSNGNTLKVLALESRAGDANMSLLTQKSVQDAAMVKVLTIVTLVYLPVTVVTNFFSTEFITSTTNSTGSVQLSVVPEVWILFAASVPLTIFTIYVWWIFAQREVLGQFPGGLNSVIETIKAALKRTQKSRTTAGIHP